MAPNRGVSIIIDSYNHEKFVASAIESALAQDHAHVQVIVIDDGSPDRSQEIIAGFGDKIQTVFQNNQGQVAACRNALALAKNDIVIILDSDDLLEPNAASTVTAVWRRGVVKVQYSLKIIDEHSAFSGIVFPKYGPQMTPETVYQEVCRAGSYPDSPTSGNAYDRRFLEIAMPLLPRRNGIDGELNGIAPLYGDVITICEPLGSYRIHGDNDFAQNRLVIKRFETYLHHSEARFEFIRDHYRSKGHTIKRDALSNDLKYIEYRIVVEKLGKSTSDPSRRLAKVAGLGLRAAWHSPHKLPQRVFRMSWMLMMSILPIQLAMFLAEQRFVANRRWQWIRRLTAMRSGNKQTLIDRIATSRRLGHTESHSKHV